MILPNPTPRHPLASRAAAALLAVVALAALAACATPAPPPEPAPVGVADLADRPAERTLLSALRSYDDADYLATERLADEALKLGLRSPRDQATAHKLRAFVYCTSNRLSACEGEFRAARACDPAFALTRAEAGHPVWGPVYLQSRQ